MMCLSEWQSVDLNFFKMFRFIWATLAVDEGKILLIRLVKQLTELKILGTQETKTDYGFHPVII